jgi:hypothetical protein
MEQEQQQAAMAVPPTHPALAHRMAKDQNEALMEKEAAVSKMREMEGAYGADVEAAHMAGREAGANEVAQQIQQNAVGVAATQEQPQSIMELAEGAVYEGASMEELASSGILEALQAELLQQGATPEQVDGYIGQLDGLATAQQGQTARSTANYAM